MAANDSENLTLTLDDLETHFVRYGLDVFPPLDLRDDTTHAHELFRALNEQWRDLYQELTFSPANNQFSVFASFSGQKGAAKLGTLVFAPRGPVFRFPRRFPAPTGRVMTPNDLDSVFFGSLTEIRRCFAGLKVLRAGLVQEVIFSTGRTSPIPWLASRFGSIAGTEPRGGSVRLTYRDPRCSILISVETVETHRQVKLASGAELNEPTGFGLKVEFDVCNSEMKEQELQDIQMTLERAQSLWPAELLKFLNWRGPR